MVIVEPGETITVTSAGQDTYKFEGSTGWTFVAVVEVPAPQPGPGGDDPVEASLTDFLSLTDYSGWGVNLLGVELGTTGFTYTPATWTTPAEYPVDGAYIKLEVYSENGTVAAGTYTPSADPNALVAGEFKTGSQNGGTTLFVVKNGSATPYYVADGTVTVAKEGDVYTIAVASTTVAATYVGKLSAEAASGIVIDGDMSDWASIEGTTGTGGTNAAFKVASDENNIYFYVKRTTNRMSDLWGGNGYHYYTFDLDNNPETGVELWGNGPYEMLLVIYPYAGSADAPAFGIAKAGTPAPDTCNLENAVIKGVVTDSGVETEVSIPRADLLDIPATPVNVYYWSNKDGSEKLGVTVTL